MENTHRNRKPLYRRSMRLAHYDYRSSGAYFVTVCVQRHKCLFGLIADGKMQLNALGEIVEDCWRGLPAHYEHVALDAFVVMPNHFHGIVVLKETEEGKHGLSEIVRAFKSFSARHVNTVRRISGTSLWQRGYYEHVIRNDIALNDIRRYIEDNPARWELDRENPANIVLCKKGAGLRPAPTDTDGIREDGNIGVDHHAVPGKLDHSSPPSVGAGLRPARRR